MKELRLFPITFTLSDYCFYINEDTCKRWYFKGDKQKWPVIIILGALLGSKESGFCCVYLPWADKYRSLFSSLSEQVAEQITSVNYT